MGAQHKRALYDELTTQLAALLQGESDPIANAANTAGLIYHGLPDLNWAGFYFARPPRNPSLAYPLPFPPPPAEEGDTPAPPFSPSPQAEKDQGGGMHAT